MTKDADGYIMTSVALRVPKELSYLDNFPNNVKASAIIRQAEFARCILSQMKENPNIYLKAAKCFKSRENAFALGVISALK